MRFPLPGAQGHGCLRTFAALGLCRIWIVYATGNEIPVVGLADPDSSPSPPDIRKMWQSLRTESWSQPGAAKEGLKLSREAETEINAPVQHPAKKKPQPKPHPKHKPWVRPGRLSLWAGRSRPQSPRRMFPG